MDTDEPDRYNQNSEYYDSLDMFEKGEHKRPKVVVVKPAFPEQVTVSTNWDDPEQRKRIFEGIDWNDN